MVSVCLVICSLDAVLGCLGQVELQFQQAGYHKARCWQGLGTIVNACPVKNRNMGPGPLYEISELEGFMSDATAAETGVLLYRSPWRNERGACASLMSCCVRPCSKLLHSFIPSRQPRSHRMSQKCVHFSLTSRKPCEHLSEVSGH